MAQVRDGVDAKEIDEAQVALRASEIAVKAVEALIPTPTPIKEELPLLGRVLRKALKKRLRISDIKGLKEALDKKVVFTGSGTGIGGGHIRLYDISDQLNGTLKVFSLPAFWRVVDVKSSSFPNAFRPTTDYTVDASAMTITFTSEITAGTTLATGQTVLVQYATQ